MYWSVPQRPSRLRAWFAAAFGAITLLAIAGCTSDLPRGELTHRLGDTEPVAAVSVATRMPIQGIDVSHYAGDVDWRAVRQAGISFAYLKTTEGGDHTDPKFAEYWRQAAAAGVYRGAYHFMYWCRPADEQALYFMVNVPNDPDALPPVLDLEWNHASKTCPGQHSDAKVLPMIGTLLDAMEARTGKRPIIYTDITFYRDVLQGSAFAGYPFWLRSTAALPQKAYPGQSLVFWQFTSTGRVPGIDGNVDRNAFNGSADDWARWLESVGVVRSSYAGIGGRWRAG
jgi:lysozyme